jgi:hypothetical protein
MLCTREIGFNAVAEHLMDDDVMEDDHSDE